MLSENARVRQGVKALRTKDMRALAALLDASHASLRDDYEVSVPEVERTVERMKAAGAAGRAHHGRRLRRRRPGALSARYGAPG